MAMRSPQPPVRSRSRPSSLRRALPPLSDPPLSGGTRSSPARSSEAPTPRRPQGIGRSASAVELRRPPQASANANPLASFQPVAKAQISAHAQLPANIASAKIGPWPGALVSAPPKGSSQQQQAVYERMQSMLASLQEQYAEKVSALVRETQTQAEAVVRDQQCESGEESPEQVDQGQAQPIGPAASEAKQGAGNTSLAAAAASDMHAKLVAEVIVEGDASSAGSEIEDERDEDVMLPEMSAACSNVDPNEKEERSPSKNERSPSKNKASCVSAQKKVSKKKSKRKKQEGINCIKTINFEGNSVQPVRCAVTVQDEVWTADWSGRLHIRDRDDVEKIKAELPSQAIVWCMAFVPGSLPLVWIGQERAGIPVFHASTKKLLCTLTGGHSGNVLALTVAEGPNDRKDIYSAGNDFSIRCWHLERGTGKDGGAQLLPGKTPMQIRRGNVLYWHKNGVRCLLRIGPVLWSGGDDKAICLWKVVDGERLESIEEAHEAGVMSMVIAGRGVWSSGYDGRVKEWSIGGAARECTREIKFDEPLRALCPVGDHVWMCGQSRNISVYASDMTQVDSLEGHSSYVSSLLLVDRSETRLLWSSSLADKSLRVWRHVLRGGTPSTAELAAANKLHEEQQWNADIKIQEADARTEQVLSEFAAAQAEFTNRYQDALVQMASAERSRELAEAACARSQEREEAANQAGSKARAEVTGLREEVRLAFEARKVAEEAAATNAAIAAEAQAATSQLTAERDTARGEVARQAVELTTEKQRGAGLQQKLATALAAAADGAASAAELSRELIAQESTLAAAQVSLLEETRRCTEFQVQIRQLQAKISQLEGERDESRSEVRSLECRYAQLDVFKLDIIARELKNVDKQIDALLGDSKSLLQASKKFTDYAASQACSKLAMSTSETSTKLRGTVRDVIERCLSETQKLHVGAAIQDAKAAGILKDGGCMGMVIGGSEGASAAEPRRGTGGGHR